MSATTPPFRVLLVEDEYLSALYLSDLLEERGMGVIGPCPDLATAFDALDGARPDAALLDVNLQGEEVYPLADRLVARGIPFAFTSGYGNAHLPARFATVDVCLKPVDPAALLEMLARIRAASAQ